ncbi:MAG: leucine-rich repeat protein [Clostridia bacterium]|nr:leucine-rich repeat protein [Clostridia bacterium]
MKQKKLLFLAALLALLLAFTCAHAAEAPDASSLSDLLQTVSFRDIPEVLKTAVLRGSTNASPDATSSPTANLPASLRIIEAEAFEGTMLVKVDLPESVETIGDRAFANIPTLRVLKIPVKATSLGEGITAGSRNAAITAAPGSMARAYARDHGIPYAPVAAFSASAQVSPVAASNPRPAETLAFSEAHTQQQLKPTVRPAGEIKDDRYEEGIAYHILGRAPPACA